MPIVRPRSLADGTIWESGPGLGNTSFERAQPGCLAVEAAPAQCDSGAAPRRGAARAAQNSQVGKAAWYDLVGHQTASGEILDKVTATAAHRSLPLASFAEVTDLDNGRAVIVKINDRGPYTPGRIIDLSPRAADVLDMKSAGVANVVIQPLLKQRDLIVAAFQTSGTPAAP
jgi:rare lipoprotein A